MKKSPLRCWPASRECSSACSLARAWSAQRPRLFATATPRAFQTWTSAAWSPACSSNGRAASASASSSAARALAHVEPVVGGHRACEGFAGRIALRGGALGGTLEQQRRPHGSRRRTTSPRGRLRAGCRAAAAASVQRALEQRARGSAVLAPERSPAGGGEPLAGARGQVVRRLPELAAVGGSLLEVVADDLVQLDELRRARSSQSAKRSCSSARTLLGSAS